MPYNRDIQNQAPLPSGPLPTDQELGELIKRGRQRQAQAILRLLRHLFRH